MGEFDSADFVRYIEQVMGEAFGGVERIEIVEERD